MASNGDFGKFDSSRAGSRSCRRADFTGTAELLPLGLHGEAEVSGYGAITAGAFIAE